jgi:hypothetical protein
MLLITPDEIKFILTLSVHMTVTLPRVSTAGKVRIMQCLQYQKIRTSFSC